MDEEGNQKGVVDFREALGLARERGYDLIEIAPTANPPVCKLMDYGKFKYEQGRRDREAHKKQKVMEVKGIRLRPRIDDHDLEVKLKRMLEFLRQGNKVKTTVIFRSREITHPEFARRSLEKLAEATADCSVVEKAPSFEGRTMTMILAPKSAGERDKTEKKKIPTPNGLAAGKGGGIQKEQPGKHAKGEGSPDNGYLLSESRPGDTTGADLDAEKPSA